MYMYSKIVYSNLEFLIANINNNNRFLMIHNFIDHGTPHEVCGYVKAVIFLL